MRTSFLKNVFVLAIGFAITFAFAACKNRTQNSNNSLDTNSNGETKFNSIEDSLLVVPKYAKGFTVEYKDGAKLLSITDPESKSSKSFKFALVERGNNIEVPKDYKKIEIPVRSVICMTTLQLAGFITLDELDKVVGITSTKFLHNKQMRDRIDRGQTAKIGIEGSFDSEVIMKINPDVIFISPFKRGGYESLKEVNIPLVPHLGYKELSPLGQAEWIKFIALFTNNEKKANEIFNAIEQRYNSLKDLTANVKNRPVVFSGEIRGGSWYTVGGQSFLAQIFRDAGADYFLKDNTESGGVTLDFETIYNNAANADYWRILNSFNGTFSYNALKREDLRYADFKAFKNKGVIYCNLRDKGFYENSPTQPDLVLKDFIKVFHPDLLEKSYEGTFYRLLK